MNPILPAACWCALLLGGQLVLARRRGRRGPFAPAAGDAGAGARYAFTGAMLPWAKESVRMNPGAYAAGMVYHAGLAAAFLAAFTGWRVMHFAACAGAAAGLALLLKRIAQPELRGLSGPGDYFANALATAFAGLAGAAAFLPGAAAALPWACAALLVCIPLGKLRHGVFFFAARRDLGHFFGRRGVWPPAGA